MNTVNVLNKVNICAFIGRMEPPHIAHIKVIEEGLRNCDFMLILLGSANEARSTRNPFTTAERIEMLSKAFNYNINEWLKSAHKIVDGVWEELKTNNDNLPNKPTVALIGHAKDKTSYYLDLFPTWTSINVPQTRILSATSIRKNLFSNLDVGELGSIKNKAPLKEYLNEFWNEALGNAIDFLTQEESKYQRHETSVLHPTTIVWLKSFCRTKCGI